MFKVAQPQLVFMNNCMILLKVPTVFPLQRIPGHSKEEEREKLHDAEALVCKTKHHKR